MLCASNLFKEKNIQPIDNNSYALAREYSLLLVYYPDVQNEIFNVLSKKNDSAAMVIYQPQSKGFIEQDVINKINEHRNAIVVNFRGRLLNDILTSLITTSYEKK